MCHCRGASYTVHQLPQLFARAIRPFYGPNFFSVCPVSQPAQNTTAVRVILPVVAKQCPWRNANQTLKAESTARSFLLYGSTGANRMLYSGIVYQVTLTAWLFSRSQVGVLSSTNTSTTHHRSSAAYGQLVGASGFHCYCCIE